MQKGFILSRKFMMRDSESERRKEEEQEEKEKKTKSNIFSSELVCKRMIVRWR